MKNKHDVLVKIDNDEWNKALDKSFQKNVAKAKVDGFREGKCPRDVYEKKFGKESLYMDAVDFVLPTAYKKALEDSKLEPIVQPSVDIKNIDDTGVEVVFTIITKPKVEIKKYKGLNVEKTEVKVEANEIEEEIEVLRNKYAEVVLKDGVIENGDTAVIDFEGFKGDTPFEGGKGENYPLEIGSNSFIPGFEEQLIGLKAKDEKDINLAFPEDYPSEDLKGQDVVFKVKVQEVKTKKTPELNEDFYLDLGYEDVKNEKELENKIKEELITKKEQAEENKYIDKLLEAIANETEVELPDELIEAETSRIIDDYKEKLKMQGITLEQYLEFTKSSMEQLKEQLKEESKKNVLYRLTIEEIKNKENITASDEEVNEEAEKLSANYQMPKDELIKIFGGIDMIRYDLEMRKTIEFLKSNN